MDLCESPNTKEKDSVVPVTPQVVKEKTADFEFQSPLTLSTTVVLRKQFDNDSDNHSPRTPKDVVFDPFAPPTKDAHHTHSKYLDEFRTSVVRRLCFRSSAHDADSLSDQHIFESIYNNLLHFILFKQMEEELLPPMSNLQRYDSDDDECKSPPSMLRFTGIAHTCPPAPRKLKPANQPKIIQLELCKKLEF
ncbi:hypothetical protein TSUD_391500 [Trifolium subterraneum]|uniref:Uncharacterized protein n=1 Tax=Trifolium subterraneum TaxID=3900 RepID=A0A2Z6N081_TRISU|nr:hypothetical protein TSUD_391500 [Trifolium subterraneum]